MKWKCVGYGQLSEIGPCTEVVSRCRSSSAPPLFNSCRTRLFVNDTVGSFFDMFSTLLLCFVEQDTPYRDEKDCCRTNMLDMLYVPVLPPVPPHRLASFHLPLINSH